MASTMEGEPDVSFKNGGSEVGGTGPGDTGEESANQASAGEESANQASVGEREGYSKIHIIIQDENSEIIDDKEDPVTEKAESTSDNSKADFEERAENTSQISEVDSKGTAENTSEGSKVDLTESAENTAQDSKVDQEVVAEDTSHSLKAHLEERAENTSQNSEDLSEKRAENTLQNSEDFLEKRAENTLSDKTKEEEETSLANLLTPQITSSNVSEKKDFTEDKGIKEGDSKEASTCNTESKSASKDQNPENHKELKPAQNFLESTKFSEKFVAEDSFTSPDGKEVKVTVSVSGVADTSKQDTDRQKPVSVPSQESEETTESTSQSRSESVNEPEKETALATQIWETSASKQTDKMGSGASKEEEVVVEEPGYSQQVKSQAGFSDAPRSSRSQASMGQRGQVSRHGGMSSIAESRGSRISRVEGYDVHIIQISKDGFSTNDVTVMEGQVVTFMWDETCSPSMSIMQVVYDGENLRPVVGGFSASPTDHHREYDQLFSLEGEYKFAINKIRCTPFSVNVVRRTDLNADVTDEGFNPPIICIDQGHAVSWTWKSCNTPHTVNEVHYVMDRGCFRRQQGKNQNMVATVTGKHRHQFNRPGLYFFKTESSQLGKSHVCVVCVRAAHREYLVEVLDRTFSPMILLIEEGDRVWWRWDRNKCKKLHHIYQIDAPPLDHKEDAPYEPMPEGFRWHHNPSKQGLMCHQFKTPGVYYFSDQNYDEAAFYIGTIIVKPKPKEHRIELKGKGFNPEILYAQTGDRVWWTWDGDAVVKVKETLLLMEDDKVLNPASRKQLEGEEDENLLQGIDEDGLQVMTKAGLASVTYTTIGVYTYRINDVSNSIESCSVIVNPGPKNHTVHLTDTGFEPKVVTIRPNDRVWWVWQSGKKQHNVVQVSHQGVPITDGFCSGLPRDSPSAFQHQFMSPGVFYFISKSLPKIFGAIVVTTQSQVHEVRVGREIVPDPVTLQLNDIICWVFDQVVRQGVTIVDTVDKILDATFTNIPINGRRCIGQAVTKLGITHFHSRSFQRATKQKNAMQETRMSSAVCDERGDYSIIKVNSRGFHPKELYLQRGQSVMWTWKGSDEEHNIIHVTDPKGDAPLNVIQGPKAFNSGKILLNNCFLYTFDEVGDYAVASQGAPGYSCIISVGDEVPRTAEPYITSDVKGGTVERYYRIDLSCKTPGAEIYYTTDGSLPALHHEATKHYHPDKGVHLRESGLCFVRAIAVKAGQVHSHPFTSRRYWVLSEGDNEVSMDDNSNSQEVEAKQTTSWDWWDCKPQIKGCFTGPGTVEVFWDLPKSQAAKSQIKGYQVFLNGVSYCSMFPRSNNSLNITGMAGGRVYKIYVMVYPIDPQNVPQQSNSLNLKCPIETEFGGPVISLVKTEKPDSLAIVWMSIDKPDLPIDGYLIYLNDQQCGPKLVPDPESNRCKVVIGSCELNTDYKIHVQALVANSKETRTSNVLEVILPLNTRQFKYPPVKERQEEEDLYMEYIEVAEGSGYMTKMDDPDNPIWETETDTTSGEESETEPGKKKKKRKKDRTKVTTLDKKQVQAKKEDEREEHHPDCTPLSENKPCLRSFPTIESYSNFLLERQTLSESAVSKPRLSFYIVARVVGRLSSILKFLRVGSVGGYDKDEIPDSSSAPDSISAVSWGTVKSVAKATSAINAMGDNRTAQFAVTAPRGDVKENNEKQSADGNIRPGILVDRHRQESSIRKANQAYGIRESREPVDIYKKRMVNSKLYAAMAFRKEENNIDGYQRNVRRAPFPPQRMVAYKGRDMDYNNELNYTEAYDWDQPAFDPSDPRLQRFSSRRSEYDRSPDREMFYNNYSSRNMSTDSRQYYNQEQKQVRFSDTVPKSTKAFTEVPQASDSSFSDDDDSVEHLYQSPRYSQETRVSPVPDHSYTFYGPSENSERELKLRRKQEEYFQGFESDQSNYDNSREGSITESRKGGHTHVRHEPLHPKLTPRVVTSDYASDIEYVIDQPYGNVPVYGREPEPMPHPLPKEDGRMLERYLDYFTVGMEEETFLPAKTFLPARHRNFDYGPAMTESSSESETETSETSSTSETESDSSEEVQQKAPPLPVQRVVPEKPLEQAPLESSASSDDSDSEAADTGRAGKHVLFLDASKNQTTDTAEQERESDRRANNEIVAERVELVGSDQYPRTGIAIIEVQKTVALDKTGREVKATGDISEKTKLAVSTEKTSMMRVGEGEFVSGDNDGLLPSPSIMAESRDRQNMVVGWKLDNKVDSQYRLQLFVVNVVGSKFSSKINSDISFECNLVEKGKQVRGVQHCWNVQPDSDRKQFTCPVSGLLPGHTYRVYVIANYSMAKGNKPCEVQTTSSVLYYTEMGPPKNPTLRVSRVDTYQASLEWDAPVMENGLKLKGYQIFVDGKPLGGKRTSDVRQMVINNLVPGQTLRVCVSAVSEFAEQESEPSKSVHITCPPRPPAPIISQQPSYKRGSVLMAWNKPAGHTYSANEEAITFYSIFIDGKWHGEVKANKYSDQKGYQFYLTDLSSEQSYDVSVKAVAGERSIDVSSQHLYCLSESPMSNIIPVMAPAAPKSPKLRLEGLHPDGIDVTWQVPQQCGDAYISGYQMLKNGKLYGSIIPPDVNSLRIRDVTLGEKIELQLIALTEHPVGKVDRKLDTDRDSGKGSSQHDEKLTDVFTGDRYSGCKPGPKLVVHYTGLVCAPSEVWCEKATGHSALIVWKKISDSKAHFLQPDCYQVTWWPGDRPQDEIQSDSTIEDHLLITGLHPSTSYTVVVEARKMEKYTDLDEGVSVTETPDGLNAFILSSKSEQLHVKTASPPDPPSNVGVVSMTCHSLRVGWDPPKEHGSEIIAIRVECMSLDPKCHHHVAVDTLPDATEAEITGLNEKTDYLLKVIAVTEEYFDRLPDKHRHKRLRGFPQDVMASQEESIWLPSSSILIKTSGTECPTNVRVIKATTTSMTLTWAPPLVHGSNKLTGQIVRWSDVKKSRRADHEDLHIASHVSLLPTEDTLTIEDLSPGAQYKVVIEAVVSVKTSLEPDKWDGNNIEKYRRTAHVMSKPFYARTRAPIEPPKVLVTSYTQMSASLYWEKPPLMSVVGKDDEGNPKYLRRYLQGYKLEINGKLQCCLGPDSNSCTLTKCKPGRIYNVVLVAMTCTDEGRKARKQKYKSFYKSMDSKEIDYQTLLQDDENLDESPSEPVEVTLPKDQEGFLKTLEAKFQQQSDTSNKTFGDIELIWTIQGKTNLLKQFNIVWFSMDDRVIQTKYVGPEQRRTTIPVTRVKSVYHIKVEPGYYTDVLPQTAQEVQVMVPGPPDSPEIFLRSLDIDEFCIEWGEPKLYGGVKIKGYQVYLNDKKAGNELNANHNKATIPCRPNRTYRVNVVALSDQPEYGDSHKSNTLVVNPSGHAGVTMENDESVCDDAGIPVKVTKVTESGIHLDWSRFVETEDVSHYKIQWSSVAQPEQREVKLSEKDSNCVINKCLPGTTHFVRLVAYNINGHILEKSKQLTVQTSAPPDSPKLSVRACNFRYIAVQWDKPTTYGDALITGYKVYVNGIVEAVLNTDQLSYTYTDGKWCHEYAFQVQALTAGDHLNSKPSDPLVVTWPGSKAPLIRRLPSVSSSTLRVGWDVPYLTEGLKVKHYKLCCVEEDTEKLVQSIGPIHPDSREGEFKNLKKGNYSVYLEIYLYGTESVIRSDAMRMQPAQSPDPPQITVTLMGLEERRQIEKFTCDLVNKRDRLIRQVGHKLKKIGALSHPLRAEKNEDVVFGAHSLTRIEELLENCFAALENYTGQLTAHVSWQCPQSNPDIHLSGYKVLVDGKQYGNAMHSGVRTVKLQLGLEQPSYHLSMVSTSDKPKGSSAESNMVEVLSMPFKPFSFYCYHAIHKKDAKYPGHGCCKYQDSITYERQVAKKLANQGLLHKQVPPPSCSLLDIFDGEYKPLMSNHSARCPTVIFFWTPWCLSSQKMMDHYVRFAKDNTKEMTYMAVTCGMSGTTNDSRKALAHVITANSWREDRVVWHVTSECASNVYETMSSINRTNLGLKIEQENARAKYMDLTELLGIAGVPTLLFIHPDGHIAWHGRYCAFDYPAFEAFMRHTHSEVTRQPCPVFNCDCCKSDTSVDEDAMNLQLPSAAASQTRHTTTRAASPDSTADTGSHPDMKYATVSGYTDNVSGTERMFVTRVVKHKAGSPKGRRRKTHISVSKRPYSASGEYTMLDRSPYLACVAPHMHAPHKVRPRPASAKKLLHYV